MSKLTAAEKSMRGRLGAYKIHSEGKTNTAPARQAFMDRFEHEVDPGGVLPPNERAKRAAHARSLYFTRLAFKSAVARRKRR